MIYDTLENLYQYSQIAPAAITSLLKALPDFSAASPTGKTVLIENKLFILIQNYCTRPAGENKIETHSEFADLQMLLDGREFIGCSRVAGAETVRPYDLESDYALYAPEEGQSVMLPLKPGDFAIFLPEEGHIPGCGDGSPVLKMVVKIHKSLLTI